jgi:hypothetical protein
LSIGTTNDNDKWERRTMKKMKDLLRSTMLIGCLASAGVLFQPIVAHAETCTVTSYIDSNDPSKGVETSEFDLSEEMYDDSVVQDGYLYLIGDGFLKRIWAIDDRTASGNIVIPDTVRVIDSGASNCAVIKKITIPNSVEAIDERAINDTKITELTIPSSVKYIGVNAIANNTNLTSIVIQEGCTHIDMDAFQGCTSLKEAYLPSTITKMSYNWTDENPFKGIENKVTVYAKKGSFVYGYCKNILGMKVKDSTPTKPATVTSFKATKIKTNSMKLTWKKAKNANEYTVYQYVNKKWDKITTTGSTNYTVIDLKPATTYKFKIIPSNTNKNSSAKGKSTTMSAYTKTATPNLTAVTQESNKSAILTFDKEATSKNYEVYVSTNGKKYSKVATFKNSSSGKDTYTLKKGLKSGKTNYVKIKCYTKIGGKKVYSGYSQVIQVQF